MAIERYTNGDESCSSPFGMTRCVERARDHGVMGALDHLSLVKTPSAAEILGS